MKNSRTRQFGRTSECSDKGDGSIRYETLGAHADGVLVKLAGARPRSATTSRAKE